MKKSKSEEHLKVSPVKIERSKSDQPFYDEKYPYTTLISQGEEIENLKKETKAKSDTIALLRKKIASLETDLPHQLLQDQLNQKQQEIEELREKLETTNQELNSLKKARERLLADNLNLKHQSLKDWWVQYQQTQELEEELKEQVDYASEELVEQDKRISSLQSQNIKLKQQNQSLAKDLELTTKLVELRSNPLALPSKDNELRRSPLPEPNFPWLSYTFTFLLIGCLLWLTVK